MLLRSQALWLQTRAPPLPCQRQLAKEELQFELVRTPTSPVRIPLGLTGISCFGEQCQQPIS